MTDRQLLELLLEKVTNIESDQNVMKADIANVKDDIVDMKADMGNMKDDIVNMKADMGNMKDDIVNMKADMGNMKDDIVNMKDELKAFRVEQDRHGDLLHQLIQIVGTTNAKVDNLAAEMRAGFEKVETDISILFEENLNRKREITRLQQASV